MSSDLEIVGLLCDYDWQLGSCWLSFSLREYFCMVMILPLAQILQLHSWWFLSSHNCTIHRSSKRRVTRYKYVVANSYNNAGLTSPLAVKGSQSVSILSNYYISVL